MTTTARRRLARWAPLACIGVLVASVLWFGREPVQKAHYGDDQEYLTMVTSFMRHGSPDFRPGDDSEMLRSLPRKWQRSLTKKFKPGVAPPYAYFESRDHRYFGWHFFTYPAAVVPLRSWLDGRPDAFRAHQYTNLLVFCCALSSLLLLRRRPALFWSLTPLSFLGPVLWFLTYAHTEAFVFSLGILALTCQLSGRPLRAILFNSLAATQYQPLALLSLFLCAHWLWQQRGPGHLHAVLRRPGRLLGALACTALVFVPGCFYYVHFGTPNLIAREGLASSRLMSAQKFGWMFVDPNGGMLFYAPGLLLLLLAAAWWSCARAARERTPWGVGLLGCVLLTMLASTVQRNWNHPTFGVSRYVLYGLAPVLLFIGSELAAQPRLTRGKLACVFVAIALQLGAQLEHGFFRFLGFDAAHHSAAAQFVLERWPALYSPHSEIFCERTKPQCPTDAVTGEVLPEHLPVTWQDSHGRARKILAADCDPEKILRSRSFRPDEIARIHAQLQDCKGPGPIYVDL